MTEAVNKSIKINEHIYAPIPIAIEPIIIKYLLGLNLEAVIISKYSSVPITIMPRINNMKGIPPRYSTRNIAGIPTAAVKSLFVKLLII